MTLAIHLQQAVDIEVGVALCRAQPCVTEQFLNRPQIGPRLQEMGREPTPEELAKLMAGTKAA